MSSVDPLDAVLKVIAAEARRSPDFLAHLERALGLTKSKETLTRTGERSKRPHRRTPAVLDPFEILRANGPEELRVQLSALTLEQLRDVVAQHRVEPYVLAMKWKNPSRLVALISETIELRARKGESFR